MILVDRKNFLILRYHHRYGKIENVGQVRLRRNSLEKRKRDATLKGCPTLFVQHFSLVTYNLLLTRSIGFVK
jgi:hypothetical protein